MKKYLEIKAFPLNAQTNSISSPILSLFSHFDNKQDEYIEVYYIRISASTKCILGVDEKYKDIALSIFSSFRYIITDVDFTNEMNSCNSSIILHRKAQFHYENKESVLDYSVITASINSPTLSYLFTRASDGSGIAFILGRFQDNPPNDPLRFVKDSADSYIYKSREVLDSIFSASRIYVACAFVFGDSEEQLHLATEMCYNISGWDYSYLSKSIDLHNSDITDCLDAVFSSGSLVREGRSSIKDRRQFLLLRCVTETEFHSIIIASESVFVDSIIPLNLDTLWNDDAYSFFQKRDNSICIGTSLYNDCEYHLPRHKLRQGLLIVGSPGSGKGNQLFHLIEQLRDVPLLIFESAKQEMHNLRQIDGDKEGKGVPNLNTWRPKANDFLLNPFEIPEGLTLSEYRASLVQMLRTCFRLDGPLEELFVSTLNRCFYKANYTDSSCSNSTSVQKWGLHEFIIEYSNMIKESGYSPKTKDDMRQAGLTRLKAMLDSNPDVYDTDHSINLIDLIKENSCNLIQLNSLPTIDAKQSLATMILIALGAYMQLRFEHCADQNELRLVIIMDESHNLLKTVNDPNGVSYSFADDFANLMLTLRSVGVGFIISDQTTANIPKVITDVCDTKMFMGSSRFSGISDYLDFLSSDERLLENLYRLKAGSGVFSVSNAPHGVFFQTPKIIDKYLIKDVSIHNSFRNLPSSQKAATFIECHLCPYCNNNHMCCLESKQKARQIAQQMILLYGNPFLWDYSKYRFQNNGKNISFDLLSRKQQIKCITKALVSHMNNVDNPCAVIQWLRACNLEYDTSFSFDEIKTILNK